MKNKKMLNHQFLNQATIVPIKKYHFLLMLFSISMFISPLHAAEGIFIYRQSAAHPVGGSIALEYNSYRQWESLTEFRTAENGVVKVTKFQPSQILPYINPQAPGLEIRANSADFWKQEYLSYLDAYNTYPASRIYLVNQVKQLKEVSTQLSLGNAWFEGKWQKDQDVANIIAERNRTKMKAEKDKVVGKHNEKINQQIEEEKAALASVREKIHKQEDSIKLAQDTIRTLSASADQEVFQFNANVRAFLQELKH